MTTSRPKSLARPTLILTATLLACAAMPGTLAAKILFPPDHSLLKGDGKIAVLAFRPSTAASGTLAVEGKGGAKEYPAGVGAVEVKVSLPPGRATLRLDGQTVDVFLAGEGAGEVPAGFEVPDTHAVDNDCPDCHRVEQKAAPLLDTDEKLCLRCHDDPVKGKGQKMVLHPPVVEGNCLACHKLHRASIKKLSAAALRAICLECHKDPAKNPEGRDWEAPHPALDGGCRTCHAAHASEGPGLLKADQASLCAGCHTDKRLNPAGSAWATPHAPVAKGMCASCHGPHGASFKPLLSRSGNKVCWGCHQKPHKHHQAVALTPEGRPSNRKATIPPGFPVSSDGVLGCGGCHLPHGSDQKRLWVGDMEVLCTRCHRKF